MKTTHKTDVLIVGAGPTGLMLANQLQRYNIDFKIIDTKLAPTVESRALAVSARSMELYQQLGLDETIVKSSLFIKGFQIYMNGRKKLNVSMLNIGEGLTDFSNMMTIFEQNKNETLLYKNLQSMDKEVDWGIGFEDLEDKGAYLEIKTKQGAEELIYHCQYIIGCDGAKSPVRHQRDFTFEGGTYENIFYVADIVLDSEFTHDQIVIAPDKNIFCSFFPMEGTDRYRLVGTLPLEYETNEGITFDDIKEAVKTSSNLEVTYKEVNWFSVYKLHHRCVDELSKGRIFLAGDSAHIHSPAGGQGMNTGLQDAHNLAWKMAFVLKGWADESILKTYNEERLPFAKFVLGFTDRGFTMISSRKWYIALFRKYVMINVLGLVIKLKKVRLNMFHILSQIWYGYEGQKITKNGSKQKLKFKSGERVPYLKTQYYKNFQAVGFHIIHIGEAALNPKAKKRLTTSMPFPIAVLENKMDDWAKFGVDKELFILVRPDMYIGLMEDSLDENKLQQYFSELGFHSCDKV